MDPSWLPIADRIGQLIIVVLFLRFGVTVLSFMRQQKEVERAQGEGYVDQLRDVGKECHAQSQESQRNYQEQMSELIQQSHEDNKLMTRAISDLTIEVGRLNALNGRTRVT